MYIDASDAFLTGVFVLVMVAVVWLVARRNRRDLLAGQAELRAELAAIRTAHEERSGAWQVMNKLTERLLGDDPDDTVVIPMIRHGHWR